MLPPVKTNARTCAATSAWRSIGRFRMSLSFVRTIQPSSPARVSHSSSGVSCAKTESCVTAATPAAISAAASFRPSDRLTKNVGSGGFVPEGFFDFFRRAIVILG
jgi:hypothetical protein